LETHDSDSLGEKLIRETSGHGDLSSLGHGIVDEGRRLREKIKRIGLGQRRRKRERSREEDEKEERRSTYAGVCDLGSGGDDGSSSRDVRDGSSGEEEGSVDLREEERSAKEINEDSMGIESSRWS